MKYLIISGNPKKNGLCYSLAEEVKRGAEDGGAEAEIINLEKLERCHVCDDGWGTCREKHVCTFGNDGFNEAQSKVRSADALCFITPVYWAEMAESLKCFFDRLRRCENLMSPNGALAGKQVLLIASPGGSGNGMLTCLEQMDRFCRHTNAIIFDYIGVNRWNNDYKKPAIYAAAKAMSTGRKNGETI
ncbi:flavodoxin family protein [Spirochaetia bacterium]|nr:flavodoxin family protein [Spirochaetia bacterium]GHU33984.1 flavodoxin family protein [Spirochaetia bacterium]